MSEANGRLVGEPTAEISPAATLRQFQTVLDKPANRAHEGIAT